MTEQINNVFARNAFDLPTNIDNARFGKPYKIKSPITYQMFCDFYKNGFVLNEKSNSYYINTLLNEINNAYNICYKCVMSSDTYDKQDELQPYSMCFISWTSQSYIIKSNTIINVVKNHILTNDEMLLLQNDTITLPFDCTRRKQDGTYTLQDLDDFVDATFNNNNANNYTFNDINKEIHKYYETELPHEISEDFKIKIFNFSWLKRNDIDPVVLDWNNTSRYIFFNHEEYKFSYVYRNIFADFPDGSRIGLMVGQSAENLTFKEKNVLIDEYKSMIIFAGLTLEIINLGNNYFIIQCENYLNLSIVLPQLMGSSYFIQSANSGSVIIHNQIDNNLILLSNLTVTPYASLPAYSEIHLANTHNTYTILNSIIQNQHIRIPMGNKVAFVTASKIYLLFVATYTIKDTGLIGGFYKVFPLDCESFIHNNSIVVFDKSDQNLKKQALPSNAFCDFIKNTMMHKIVFFIRNKIAYLFDGRNICYFNFQKIFDWNYKTTTINPPSSYTLITNTESKSSYYDNDTDDLLIYSKKDFVTMRFNFNNESVTSIAINKYLYFDNSNTIFYSEKAVSLTKSSNKSYTQHTVSKSKVSISESEQYISTNEVLEDFKINLMYNCNGMNNTGSITIDLPATTGGHYIATYTYYTTVNITRAVPLYPMIQWTKPLGYIAPSGYVDRYYSQIPSSEFGFSNTNQTGIDQTLSQTIKLEFNINNVLKRKTSTINDLLDTTDILCGINTRSYMRSTTQYNINAHGYDPIYENIWYMDDYGVLPPPSRPGITYPQTSIVLQTQSIAGYNLYENIDVNVFTTANTPINSILLNAICNNSYHYTVGNAMGFVGNEPDLTGFGACFAVPVRFIADVFHRPHVPTQYSIRTVWYIWNDSLGINNTITNTSEKPYFAIRHTCKYVTSSNVGENKFTNDSTFNPLYILSKLPIYIKDEDANTY